MVKGSREVSSAPLPSPPAGEAQPSILRPWLVTTVFHLTTLPAALVLMCLIGLRHFEGWSEMLKDWWVVLVAYPVFVYQVRNNSDQLNHRPWTGYWFKTAAVLYALGGLGLTRLAIEPATLSAWSPGVEAWALWIVIVYFWLIAPVAYVTGDAILRYYKAGKNSAAAPAVRSDN